MPARGYRKGVSDHQAPVPMFARTRLPADLHHRVVEDARARRLTVSKLLRALVEAHYRNRPVPRVRSTGPSYAVARELNRIGVNLNQLTHVANATRQMAETEIRDVLRRVTVILQKL